MRKIFFSLLLATTVATPALARPGMGDPGDRASARQEHKADSSSDHKERSQAHEQRSEPREQRPQVQQERGDIRQRMEARQAPMQQSESPAREIVRERGVRDNRQAKPANVNERGRPTLDQREGAREGVNNWRGQRDVRQQQIEQRADRNRVRPPAGARPDRPAPAPESAYNNHNRHSKWRTDWRRDHRYDWHDYRNQHRSIFRLGAYFDPFGWGYQRYNIGWRLWPSYYSSNYWLSDPYMYRLPYAPFPYKWVRYYDDALLVDTFSGQVVDVMHDFFW